MRAQDKINFDPTITQGDFGKFSRVLAQAIYSTPVEPARASGLLGFDVGVAASLIRVDQNARYIQKAVSGSITTHGYIGVPRLVVSKGFGAGTIFGSYARLNKSGGISVYGGGVDIPVFRGSLVSPEIAVRATYAQISGVKQYKLKTYGVEAFVSKGIGPFTPYLAVGRSRDNARGFVPATTVSNAFTLTDQSQVNRYTAGVRFSLLVPKLDVEVTQAEVRTYAAKVSIGF